MSVLKIKDENEAWIPIPSIVGEPAGFGTVSATVDANHGTPAVTVTASGDDTAKNFAFAFSNLQPAPYDDSVIQARMDSFTNLAEGSTTGDAELIDGRVGDDGVTYNNIGTAIRTQFSDVKSALKLIADNEIISFTSGYLWCDAYTVDITTPRSSSTGYQYAIVPCQEGDSFLVSGTSAANNPCAWAFVEADGTIVTKSAMSTVVTNKTLVAPAGAAYLTINRKNQGDSIKGKTVDSRIFDNPVRYAAFSDLLKNSFDFNAFETAYTPTIEYTNKYINAGDGVIDTYSGSKVSELIDCSEWGALQFSGKSYYVLACISFYDTDGACVQTYPANGDAEVITYTNQKIAIPSNAKYVRFGDNRDVIGGSFAVNLASSIVTKDASLVWSGKKWCAFGDSLTEVNDKTTKHYHDYIAELTGITVVNMGKSGTGYKRTEDEGFAFYQRIPNVPTDCDVVTIFGSGNDMSVPRAQGQTFVQILGDASDTGTDTICGCINTTIDNLYAIMPTVHLGIITPTPWKEQLPSDTTCPMYRLSNKIVEICKLRGIPCLDLYRCSNLRPWDATFRSLAYSHDGDSGVHPDETGHKLIAGMIKEFVASLFIPV